jgi:hypothetical protein
MKANGHLASERVLELVRKLVKTKAACACNGGPKHREIADHTIDAQLAEIIRELDAQRRAHR